MIGAEDPVARTLDDAAGSVCEAGFDAAAGSGFSRVSDAAAAVKPEPDFFFSLK